MSLLLVICIPLIILTIFLLTKQSMSQNRGWIQPLFFCLTCIFLGSILVLTSDSNNWEISYLIFLVIGPIALISFIWFYIKLALVLMSHLNVKKSIITSVILSILFFVLAIGLVLLQDPGHFDIPEPMYLTPLFLSGFSLLWLIVQTYKYFKDKKIVRQ